MYILADAIWRPLCEKAGLTESRPVVVRVFVSIKRLLARKCRLLTLTVSAPLFGRPAYLVPWGDEVRWPSGPAGLAVLCRRSSQAEDGVPF